MPEPAPVLPPGPAADVPASTAAVDTVLVVIPARDEQERIGRCLDAVLASARVVSDEVSVLVTVVLDGCTDDTAEVVGRVEQVGTVSVDSGRMGAVRSAGLDAALASAGALVDARTWVAHTDADTVVPEHWLTRQLALADTGYDLVLGTVEPAPEELDGPAGDLWRAQHRLAEGHAAVHGANLGVRLSALRAVGGYGDARSGEDAALVHRLRADGHPWVATDRTRAVTSARRDGRAEHGFAEFLRRLDATARRHGDLPRVEARLREAVLDLARRRGSTKTLCPSDAARVVDGEAFRELTVLARAAACRLADEGLVEITQRGVRVDGWRAHGPVRIRLLDETAGDHVDVEVDA